MILPIEHNCVKLEEKNIILLQNLITNVIKKIVSK